MVLSFDNRRLPKFTLGESIMKKYLIAPIRNNLLLILIFGFWVGGCSKSISATRDEDFKAILPVQDLNRSLKLSKVSVEGYGESNSFVIMVENQAESLIAFPKDYGIGLYRYINDEWTKIPNRMIYLTEENIIVRPKGSPLGFDQSHISFTLISRSCNSQFRFAWQ